MTSSTITRTAVEDRGLGGADPAQAPPSCDWCLDAATIKLVFTFGPRYWCTPCGAPFLKDFAAQALEAWR